MEGQEWRDRELWTIEIDAFFKANIKNIHKVSINRSLKYICIVNGNNYQSCSQQINLS